MKKEDCIFCNIESGAIILNNEMGFVIKDKYPQSKGHLLIIPNDHYENYFDLTEDIRNSLWDLADKAKLLCDSELSPPGYNININNGRSAGQIVMHAHIHLIPRYAK